jgi:hypothetical protein
MSSRIIVSDVDVKVVVDDNNINISTVENDVVLVLRASGPAGKS